MSREQLNNGETYTLSARSPSRGRVGLFAAGAAAGLFAINWACDRYFDRNKPRRNVKLREEPLRQWSDISDVVPREDVKASPVAWTLADVERRSLDRNAAQLDIVDRAKRPGVFVLLGTDSEIISRAKQELNITHADGEYDAVCYENETGEWARMPVEGGFKLFVPQARGRINSGQHKEILGAAINPAELGLGRMALGFNLPGGFIACPTHVAEVAAPSDFEHYFAHVPIVGETGKAA